MKHICDSPEEVTISALTEVGEKLIPALMGDFEGLKSSVQEGLQMWWEQRGELESEVGPEDGTELLPSHDKAND